MADEDLGLRLRDARDLISDRCSSSFSDDREEKSKWGLKVVLVLLHVIIVGLLFVLDPALVITSNRVPPWYTVLYLTLVLVTLALYLFTANSSPGYVTEAMRAGNEMRATFINTASLSKQSSSKRDLLERLKLNNSSEIDSSNWFQIVTDLYPPGSSPREWTCGKCKIFQPPRSKHCHDCGECILQYDHHCVWLGTCIGLKNHCLFWWYILAQSSLCAWTVLLYFHFVRLDINKAWWMDFFATLVLAMLILILTFLFLLLVFHSYLALTNQTTYELARRKRISYLRQIPEKVKPFSKGLCKNLSNFCSSKEKSIVLEPVPSLHEIQARAEPSSCLDCLCCKCC
ncbi:hypothetical protein LUZ60_016731 [Juncus effusus]|nr:hypothetical protein LUZ60_016731 [Juncus effusus]